MGVITMPTALTILFMKILMVLKFSCQLS